VGAWAAQTNSQSNSRGGDDRQLEDVLGQVGLEAQVGAEVGGVAGRLRRVHQQGDGCRHRAAVLHDRVVDQLGLGRDGLARVEQRKAWHRWYS
jgi:hypothetical protein